METLNYLSNYYESYDEDSRLVSRCGRIEFLTTMRYIEKYLRPGMRVIDIGAGTGRYSLELARRGFQVDAVELVQHNVEVFRAHITPGDPVSVVQGNALDLSAFGDEAYDVTLLLGPMYHLYTEEDQRRAMSEALRVTKKGGVVFAAYCNNDATVIQFCFQRGGLKDAHFGALVDRETFRCTSTPAELFQMCRKEDVDALMAQFDVVRLHYLGTDMAAHFMRDTIEGMDEEMFEEYLKFHFLICERPDMVGATNHMLDVFRKN